MSVSISGSENVLPHPEVTNYNPDSFLIQESNHAQFINGGSNGDNIEPAVFHNNTLGENNLTRDLSITLLETHNNALGDSIAGGSNVLKKSKSKMKSK